MRQINECNTEEIFEALKTLEVFQVVYITQVLRTSVGIGNETITASFRRLPKGFSYTEYGSGSFYLPIEEVLNV